MCAMHVLRVMMIRIELHIVLKKWIGIVGLNVKIQFRLCKQCKLYRYDYGVRKNNKLAVKVSPKKTKK